MESQVAGGEIEFLIIGRIVGDVHLAVLAGNGAVGVEHDCSVVIKTGGTLFEQ